MCTGIARPNDDIVLTGSGCVESNCMQACIVDRFGNVLNMEAIISLVAVLVRWMALGEGRVVVLVCLVVAGLNVCLRGLSLVHEVNRMTLK